MADAAKPAEAAKPAASNADTGKPKSGETYEDVVVMPTTAFDVEKPALIEDAGKVFTEAAKKNGITFDGPVRLVGVDQRVGVSATYRFEGTVK